MLRIVQTQIYRPNAPALTPEHYYRINLTGNFLAHLITSLNEKFDESTLITYEGFSIIPIVLVEDVKKNIPWKDKLKKFIDFYKSDLSNIEGLDSRIGHVGDKMGQSSKGTTAIETNENRSKKNIGRPFNWLYRYVTRTNVPFFDPSSNLVVRSKNGTFVRVT